MLFTRERVVVGCEGEEEERGGEGESHLHSDLPVSMAIVSFYFQELQSEEGALVRW